MALESRECADRESTERGENGIHTEKIGNEQGQGQEISHDKEEECKDRGGEDRRKAIHWAVGASPMLRTPLACPDIPSVFWREFPHKKLCFDTIVTISTRR